MATFLELCGDLARESGAIGTAPVAVTGQTGRQLKAVNWIIGAWKLIQNLSTDWSFLRADWSGSLTIGQDTYTGASFNIDRFGEFLGDRPSGSAVYHPTTLYDPALGQAYESEISQISYDGWKSRWDRGTPDAGQPTEYCIAPDRTIRFGASPDLSYVVRGEYRKTAQVLAANGDEPDMPERFHDIIVWRAIMLIADHDEAPPALALASAKYVEQLNNMQRELLPAITISGGGRIA